MGQRRVCLLSLNKLCLANFSNWAWYTKRGFQFTFLTLSTSLHSIGRFTVSFTYLVITVTGWFPAWITVTGRLPTWIRVFGIPSSWNVAYYDIIDRVLHTQSFCFTCVERCVNYYIGNGEIPHCTIYQNTCLTFSSQLFLSNKLKSYHCTAATCIS